MTDLTLVAGPAPCTCVTCLTGQTHHGFTDDVFDAASLDPQAGGTYMMKPILDLDAIEANLNRTEWDWTYNNYGELADKTLNFGFWNSIEELQNSYYVSTDGELAYNEAFYADDFSAFTADQRVLAREGIALWDDLIDIKFKETKSYEADITFGNTDTGGAQAYAYLPFGDIFDAEAAADGFEETGRLAGDVWIDGFVPSNFMPVLDSYYAKTTIVHELGHSLGLSHPGDYDALDDDDGDGEPDPITYANDAFFAQDSLQYSIMSYFDGYETGAQFIDWQLLNFAYPATPMVHDIAAIQAIYGADMTTRTGDTVYGFNATANRAEFDFTKNTRPIVSIWDAGGNDTLDFSGWNSPSLINLNAGAFSSGGGATRFYTLEEVNAARAALGFAPRSQASFDFYEGLKAALGVTNPLFSDNISIAYGATIENAVGGGGDDLIVANDAANRLDGGAGSDTVSYETALAGVIVDLDAGTGRFGARRDVLVNVENLTGSKFADRLLGDEGSNVLDGGAGADELTGRGGADMFVFATEGATGYDRILDFDNLDVIAVDKRLTDRDGDGLIATNGRGALGLDNTDGDRVSFGTATTLRFLGEIDGTSYYGSADTRPDAGRRQAVFEGTTTDENLAGTGDSRTSDVFFYDTVNRAPTSGDDRVFFSANDLFVTTTALAAGENGQVALDDGVLDLGGHGGSVEFLAGSGTLSALEYDGAVTRAGVTYYVYSTVGSAVDETSLFFADPAAQALAL